MGNVVVYNAKKVNLTANANVSIPLSRGDKLSAEYYLMDITIKHKNTQALIISDFDFLKALVSNVNFEAGSGNKIIDFPILDILLIQLVQRGSLNLKIKKQQGEQFSRARVFIDMTLIRFFNPKDSLFKTWKHGHRALNFEAGNFEIEHATTSSVQIEIIEKFKNEARPNIVTDARTGQQKDFNVTKKPFAKDTPIVGTEPQKEIAFPKNRKITGIIIYAESEGSIVNGCIDNIKIKNAAKHVYGPVSFDTQNVINRSEGTFQNADTIYFDNVVYIDLAQGQLVEALDTSIMELEDTALYIDLKENGHTSPKARVVFLTVA
jgi:hypothetical protein